MAPVCRTRFSHGFANKLFRGRNPAQSYLWTNVREPTLGFVEVCQAIVLKNLSAIQWEALEVLSL